MLIFFAIVGAIFAILRHARYVALTEDVTRALIKNFSGFELSDEELEIVALLRVRHPKLYREAETTATLIVHNRRR